MTDIKKMFLQLICNHDWQKCSAVYYKDKYKDRGTMVTTFICTKCEKIKTDTRSVGWIK